MKYYVFIARDEEEFSRYPGLRGGFHEKAPGFLKSVRYIEEDGYCVLILPHEAKNVDANGNVDVRRMCTNVAAAINGIGHKYSDADKICILVHLGGEGPNGIGVAKWEKALNDKLKVNDEHQNVNDGFPANREKWSIKLLSSTRKDIIDITAGTITIPERADLEQLVEGDEKFDNFINDFFVRFKDKELYLEKIFISDNQDYVRPQQENFIPLILCRNKESLRNCGVICPREYIVDLSLFDMDVNKVIYEVQDRKKFLDTVSLAEYKAWFVPLFRKYCFQDEHAHGGSHLIDLPRVGDFGGFFDGIKKDKERRDGKINALITRDSVKDDGFGYFIERETKGGVPNEAYWFDARFSGETCEIHDPYLKYKNHYHPIVKNI